MTVSTRDIGFCKRTFKLIQGGLSIDEYTDENSPDWQFRDAHRDLVQATAHMDASDRDRTLKGYFKAALVLMAANCSQEDEDYAVRMLERVFRAADRLPKTLQQRKLPTPQVQSVQLEPTVAGLTGDARKILLEIAERDNLYPAAIALKGTPRLHKHVLAARREFMYRLYYDLHWSAPRIARACGYKDHTSILHHIQAHAASLVETEDQTEPGYEDRPGVKSWRTARRRRRRASSAGIEVLLEIEPR